MKVPSGSDTAFCDVFVAELVMVTTEFGTGFPEGSVIVPERVPA